MGEHGPPRIHTEAVVLELGAGFGALILHAGAELVGHEVEVERHDTGKRTHTEVHERVVNGRTVFAGVFPELEAGSYRVLGFDLDVEIVSGQVTEVTAPSA
ncbi:MAG TPA: phospholipase [Candidatus Dormibacteraeota bacterium]